MSQRKHCRNCKQFQPIVDKYGKDTYIGDQKVSRFFCGECGEEFYILNRLKKSLDEQAKK